MLRILGCSEPEHPVGSGDHDAADRACFGGESQRKLCQKEAIRPQGGDKSCASIALTCTTIRQILATASTNQGE